MNYGPLLFLGILFTLAASWLGLVVMPVKQLGSLQPDLNTNTSVVFPKPLPGEAAQGREHYRSLGDVRLLHDDDVWCDVLHPAPDHQT